MAIGCSLCHSEQQLCMHEGCGEQGDPSLIKKSGNSTTASIPDGHDGGAVGAHPVKFWGTSVKTTLFAEAPGLMSEPGSTVSYARPMNPGSGTVVRQE
jgi:hypothetical protein